MSAYLSLFAEGLANGRRASLSLVGRNFVRLLREGIIKNANACDLDGADLVAGSLDGADLSGSSMENALLRWSDMSNADLSGANLRNADLLGAVLEGCDLTDAFFRRANLRGASRGWKTAKRADFRGAFL